jgi:sialic acid synthase SpsE/protoporphyrinogen oxidase
MKKKVIILGAGPVGLITGWLLSKKGWSVEIFEKNSKVGGMCRSWKWKDFILDTGPHIFHTSDKKLWNFWIKNFGHLFVKSNFWAKNTYDDDFKTLYDYPLSYESINNFPKNYKNIILKELKALKKIKDKTSKNFEEHVKLQVGETLTKMFFTNYPKKIWGISTNKMTAEWAPKRIKFRDKILPFFIGEYTAVGKYGTGCIYENIKDKIIKKGGKIHLNYQVIKLNNSNSEISKIYFSNKKNINVNKDDIIISTLPLTLTARLLGFKSNLMFRGVRTIYISINKKVVLPRKCHWIYYSSKNIIFNRISEHKKMSKFVSSENKTYLSAEISYTKGDDIDKLDFKEVKERVKNDLVKVGLVKNNEILDFSENKEDFVYPVQFSDYKYELSKTNAKVSKFNQIYSLGTGGEFNYADSQILFHKSMDLVNILTNKESIRNQVSKNHYNLKLNSTVKLGKYKVGDNYPVYVIAEAGLNHNGDIKLAKKLIDEAKKSGCNAVKFQSFSAESRVSKKVKSVNYAEEADGLQENIYEMFKRLSFTFKETKNIFNYAKKKKIEIFSTPFDEKNVDFLEKLNVNFYKIASVDLVNIPLLEKVAKTKKPVILSTGMSNLSNVEEAVEVFKRNGNTDLVLLHCLSSYPANSNEMNLKAIQTLKRNFNIPTGLSDHYPGISISLMAMGLGANIIERHLTLNKKFEGPDHILSSEPEEIKYLVDIAKNSKEIIGDGIKRIQPSELNVINSQRKSLYASRTIKVGEKLNKNNIAVRGPGGGILPKYIDIIIHRKVNKTIPIDHPITWSDI